MGLDIDKFSYSDTNISASFELAAYGYMKIEPLALTIQITGKNDTKTYANTEYSVTGYTAAEKNSNTLFDASKVSYGGDAVASGTDPGTYPMNLDSEKFSYNDKNVNVTFEVTDGELEIVKKTADITYVLNGGEYNGSTADIVETYDIGEEITIHEAPTREGYVFSYWKGSAYQPGDAYTVEGDHTFVAQWVAIEEPDDNDSDKKKDDTTKGVKTGDEADLAGWMLLMLIAGAGTGYIGLSRRRKED
jgi:hypothetical protein